MKKFSFLCRAGIVAAALATACEVSAQVSHLDYVDLQAIGPGYGTTNTNATSFSRDAVATFGNQQFVTYYEPVADGGNVVVARRTIGSDTWVLSPTSFVATNIHDPHDNVGLAIDGDGLLHLSWGHHAHSLRYAQSSAPVTTPGAPITFTSNLGSAGMTGNETRVTYPEFVNLADGDLLFYYRNGGSGNGDLRLNRYDTQTDAWSQVSAPLIDNASSGSAFPHTVNAYWNTPQVADNGDLHLTWNYRSNQGTFSGFQTNHDLGYARSTDGGATWLKSDGSAYGGPITQANADRVLTVAQGSSYINQSSMDLDQNDRPVVASWWAPEAGDGNHIRQYMLAWSDGTDWHSSQITDFDSEGFDSANRIAESSLRDYRMSRPTVLVNDDGRVLVLYTDYRSDNKLTLAHSMDRENWEFLELDDTDLGVWEPAIDTQRWDRDGVISMLYQTSGLGEGSETVSLFEFDARSYFAAVPEPGSLVLMSLSGLVLIRRRNRLKRAG